ncbi:pyridoxal phosphate-dependent aminotransferase [Odoribacter lunatus]|uniref:pyridoxal phosphate-dependent aminotransferase n=1 Tax=Odoribacter lunatus TaxID=2941335 RepID=UPI0020422034|nr:threonine-phosphate decarboxylase [Odoribacter lunatus]
MIHGHGDDLYKTGKEITANFSTNVWYGADSNLLQSLLNRHADKIFHYPEPDAGSLKKALARYHGLSPENIIIGNGATELFYLVAHAFAGADTAIPIPSFREYEDACRLHHHHIRYISGNALDIPADTRLMFLCNPNNPDGNIRQEQQIRSLLEAHPDMTLVIDESFIHFAPDIQTAIPLQKEYPRLLIIRSMTKDFAIPGLRLGYMLGNPETIDTLVRYKQPWTINALAIEIGKELLNMADELLPDARMLLRRQQNFARQIAQIPGFTPLSSSTTFFLVKTIFDVPRLKQHLLENDGILIRDASNFKSLDRHYFRINTLTDEKNGRLINALKNYVE